MRWRASAVITLGVVLLNCSHVVYGSCARRSRVPIRFPRCGIFVYPCCAMYDERRGVQQRPLAVTLQELQRICDTLAHHHQPPRMSWRLIWRYTLFAVAAGTRRQHRERWLRGYLMTRRRNTFRRRRERFRLIGHVIAAHMDRQALLSFTSSRASDAAQ